MKNNFFNGVLFLSVLLLLQGSCQKTEQEIRAEVEKEYAKKIDSLLQMPKSVLSQTDTEFVLAELKSVKLRNGETPVCRLSNGTEISIVINLEKGLDYKMMAKFDNKNEEALMMAAIPISLSGVIAGTIEDFLKSSEPTIRVIPVEKICFGGDCFSRCMQNCQGDRDKCRTGCNIKCSSIVESGVCVLLPK